MNVCDKRLLKIVKIRLPSDGGISRTKTGEQIRLSIGLGDQGVQQMPCKIPLKSILHVLRFSLKCRKICYPTVNYALKSCYYPNCVPPLNTEIAYLVQNCLNITENL